MQDTAETLQSALDDLTRRVAAFEKAQKQAADVGPPMLTEEQYTILLHDYHSDLPGRVNRAQLDAGKRLRYVEAELARLREGLKVQDDDLPDEFLDAVLYRHCLITASSTAAAREIQRHRKLVTK